MYMLRVKVLHWIFSTPGASACAVEATIPYSYEALGRFLKASESEDLEKISSCNIDNAIKMARRCFINAATLTLKKSSNLADLHQLDIVGVSCTASLATNRPKLGPHIAYVGSYSSNTAICSIVNFKKNARTRQEEEEIAARMMLASIVSFCKMESRFRSGDILTSDIEPEALEEDCIYNVSSTRSSLSYLDGLFTGEDNYVLCVGANDVFKTYPNVELPKGTFILPGSFDPVHEGHVAMVVAAIKATTGWQPGSGKENPPVVFEISAINVDKPPISKEKAHKRMVMFQPDNPVFAKYGLTNIAVCFTRMPLFVDKSKLFPQCNFIMGADTLERLLNPKYYSSPDDDAGGIGIGIEIEGGGGGGEPPSGSRAIDSRFVTMASTLRLYVERGQKFIVGGRLLHGAGGFISGHKIICRSEAYPYISSLASSLFSYMTEQEFRLDMSSTEIRLQQQQELMEKK